MQIIKKKVVRSDTNSDVAVITNNSESDVRIKSKSSADDREIFCKIRLLDDSQAALEKTVLKSDLGRRIFTFVCGSIGDLVESDYFGLRYTDKHGQRQWLDLDRALYKQLKGSKTFNLSFRLKHYPADPLRDVKQDLTRYLIYLQIRRDLRQGRCLCPHELMGQIGALVAQAELGDAPTEEGSQGFNSELGDDVAETNDESDAQKQASENKLPEKQISDVNTYLITFKVFNAQTPKTLSEIAQEHQKLRGLTLQEAESEILSRVSMLPTYGIDPFPATPLHKIVLPKTKSEDINESGDQAKPEQNSADSVTSTAVLLPKGLAFYLGITSTGLVTFVGLHRSQEYHWDQMERLLLDGKQLVVTLKRANRIPKKRFSLVRPKNEHLTFECESKAAALAIWHWTMDRKCFFTLKQANEAKRVKPTSNIFRRSHTYRFSGRSYQELNSTPIRNPSAEFVRLASLRRTGALNGHATLPSRLRPVNNEVTPSHTEFMEFPATTSIVAAAPPILIPDTILENPVEDEIPSLTVVNAEEVKPISEPTCFLQPVEEPPIEARQKCSLSQAAHPTSSEIRNRLDPTMIQSVVYQQVVSEFDQAYEEHANKFLGLNGTKKQLCNGHKQNNGGSPLISNGPIAQNTTDFPVKSGDTLGVCRHTDEDTKEICVKKTTKTTTLAVITFLVLLGLIVFMETSPKSSLIDNLRNSSLISTFESNIYSPVRNTLTSGLSFLWS